MFCPALPSKPTELFMINQRGCDAIQCLGYYLITSKLEHSDKILPYLINILKIKFAHKMAT